MCLETLKAPGTLFFFLMVKGLPFQTMAKWFDASQPTRANGYLGTPQTQSQFRTTYGVH